jgi:hypothetical protein
MNTATCRFIYVGEGMESLIPDEWTSPFKGKSIEDSAEFIKYIPDGPCVDWYHFPVMGEDFV